MWVDDQQAAVGRPKHCGGVVNTWSLVWSTLGQQSTCLVREVEGEGRQGLQVMDHELAPFCENKHPQGVPGPQRVLTASQQLHAVDGAKPVQRLRRGWGRERPRGGLFRCLLEVDRTPQHTAYSHTLAVYRIIHPKKP